ncbi:MAG: HAD family hydrolase [Candidatus Hodarchaeales archaeon]
MSLYCFFSDCGGILVKYLKRKKDFYYCPRCLTAYTTSSSFSPGTLSIVQELDPLQFDNVRPIFFDLDDTLVNRVPSNIEMWKTYLNEQGINSNELFKENLRTGIEGAEAVYYSEWFKLKERQLTNDVVFTENEWFKFDTAFLRGLGINSKLANQLAKKARLSFSQMPYKRLPALGALKLLKFLRQKGWPIFLLTNRLKNPAPFLKKIQMDTKFDAILYAGMFQVRKPSAEFFHKAYDWVEENLDFQTSSKVKPIYVGDSWFFDVDGALAAGWFPIYIDHYRIYQTPPRSEINSVIVSNLNQLQQRLQSYYLL